MVSLKDVAEASGVSSATVSRILNGDAGIFVKDETRERILRAAEKLKYQTRSERLGRRPKKTLRIGVAQMENVEKGGTDLYYLMLKSAVEVECYRQNIECVPLFHDEKRLLRSRNELPLDGVIVIGSHFSEEERASIRHLSNNLVLIDDVDDSGRCSCVLQNARQIYATILGEIRENHHHRLCLIGPFSNYQKGPNILADTLAEAQRDLTQELKEPIPVVDTAVDSLDAYEKTKAFLAGTKERPTFFLLLTGTISSGVLRALAEAGLHVPSEASVMVVTNTPDSENAPKPLTAIRVFYGEMAFQAVRLAEEGVLPSSVRQNIYIATGLLDHGTVGFCQEIQ
jgi:LacI family transcriptional regulator